MTPKEKAIELIDKFNNHTVEELVYLKNGKVIEGKTEAKQCALIAVDEIREALIYGKLDDSPYTSLEARQFYLQVKQEIENL
jgi:hypothetical protein